MATQLTPLAAGETCSMLATAPAGMAANCRQTRSCRSCLQTAGCIIGSSGVCTENTPFEGSEWPDYRLARESGVALPNPTASQDALNATQLWFFPAGEAKYCAADDAVCVDCIKNDFWHPTSEPDSRYCTGKDGCVCIANCKDQDVDVYCSDEFNSALTAETKTTVGPAGALSPSVGSSSSAMSTVAIIGAVAVAVVVVGFAARKLMKRHTQQAAQDDLNLAKPQEGGDFIALAK